MPTALANIGEAWDHPPAMTDGKHPDRKPGPVPIPRSVCDGGLRRLQIELALLQEWARETGARVAVVFEGRDAAGKGGTIRRITVALSYRAR